MTTDLDLYTTAATRSIDARAIDALGIPGFELMQRAATAALAELRRRWSKALRIVVLCGPGNNGGDGFLVAAQAREQGLDAEVIALRADARGDAELARARFIDGGGRVTVMDATTRVPPCDVVVDGLFGSGFNRPIDGLAALLVLQVAAGATPVLALDVPSGLDADTGAVRGPVVRAAATVCFVAWKRGLFTGRAAEFCGVRNLATLDLPAAAYTVAPDASLLTVGAILPRPRDSHKGAFGHVLVLGGAPGFGGAVRLAGEAALRSGAGLVSVATAAEHVTALLAGRPELMVRGVANASALQPPLAHATVLLVGPGLGQSAWSRELLQAALEAEQPLLLDADGLNLLAAAPRAFHERDVILTPHPGEAARLLGCAVAGIETDRFAAVRALAARYATVVVLKGAGSLIAAPDGRVAVCPWGNPGMATGGMGDVLSGVIAAWMAQGLDSWQAACLGVGLHARAGDAAARAGERGLLAGDLFPHLRHLSNFRA